ncbi:MAG: hypothetical protein RBR15_10860 [Sphaerochaeta sp.]|nr:hypothetical protein [Sphaerochaeta sp.]
MANYPEWVERCRRKGTVILRNKEGYFLYSTQSHRIPGKKNPQVTRKYIGKITPQGLVQRLEVNVDHSEIKVYEYGFSHALLSLSPEKPISGDWESMVRAIALSESPNSYFTLGMGEKREIKDTLYEQDITAYKERFITLTGVQLESLECLKSLYLVLIGGTRVFNALDDTQRALLQKLGVTIP